MKQGTVTWLIPTRFPDKAIAVISLEDRCATSNLDHFATSMRDGRGLCQVWCIAHMLYSGRLRPAVNNRLTDQYPRTEWEVSLCDLSYRAGLLASSLSCIRDSFEEFEACRNLLFPASFR